ncbi:PAS domain-containing protein [Actinoplanes sp. DH11]|uniref:PAS domain-containing protein n=1 Tax=Actinoplanes sp. DH11 TaxID=2857011 RepID=UPI001E50ED43|nr:PAS domain-containing protein [Actinoplanes sp. DH11]
MAHVELSLSGAFVPQARTPAEAEFVSSVERWSATVAIADEPCLVIDTNGLILAVSPSGSELLGLGKPAEALGRRLGEAIQLIDFTAGAGPLEEPEAEKIPPLLAVRSERLARGLMRVAPVAGESPLTVDAVATPLLTGDRVGGSLTFLSPVRY